MTIPKADIESLAGKRADDIAALLGDPALKRSDPPAQYWQYRSESCLLDIFFYEGAEGALLSRIDARARTSEHSITAAQCLNAILMMKQAKTAR